MVFLAVRINKRCRVKLVVFDVDGVLVPIRSSWGYIHEKLGTLRESKLNYHLFREKKIGYWEWMYLDTLAWIEARPGITKWDLEKLFREIEIPLVVRKAFNKVKQRGLVTALVSGGVDVLVSRIANELRADYWVSPQLAFDPWGRLIPGGLPRIEADRKDRAVLSLARSLGFSLREVAFIGDSKWDLEGMKESCLSVAVNIGDEDEDIRRIADYVASDIEEAVDVVLRYT